MVTHRLGRSSLATFVLLFATSCGTQSGPPEHREEGADRSSGAPDRYACESDADCVNASAIYEPNTCCDTGLGGSPQSRAFVEWRRGWLETHCAPEDRAGGERCTCCPTPNGTYPPGLPLPCVFEPRCHARRCTTSCE